MSNAVRVIISCLCQVVLKYAHLQYDFFIDMPV